MSTFDIEGRSVIFRFDAQIYAVEVIQRMADEIADRYDTVIELEEDYVVVSITPKGNRVESEEEQKEAFSLFCNKLLDQIVASGKR